MRVLQSLFAAAAALALAAQVGNAEQQLQHQGQQVLSAADSSVTALRRSAQQESSLAGLNGDLDLTEEEREHAALLSKLSSERAAMRVQQAAHSLSAHTEWHDEELKEAQEAVFIEELLKLTGIDSDGLPVVEGESEGEDALLLEVDESEDAKDRTEAEGGLEAGRIDLADNSTAAAFLEMAATASAEMVSMAGLEKVHGYCEICTRQIQMYQRALPDLCSGLTDTFFITCVKNMESILKADRAVVYWHSTGCLHLDDGPEIVKPCPAHVICGWVPNLFARRVGVTQAIGQLAPLCPRDINFLPRVPRTLAPGGLPGS